MLGAYLVKRLAMNGRYKAMNGFGENKKTACQGGKVRDL
jgi:hypothetical protein